MAYFLGCDVSSRKLDLSFIDGNGKQLWTDQIVNTEQDIAEFLLTATGDSPGLTLVAEATGIYHLPLVNIAYALGIRCVMYNPLLTKQQIKATVRGKKTDKTDALMIARLGLRGEGRPYVPEAYLATKYYARGQQRLAQLGVAFKHYQDHVETLLEGQMTSEAKQALADTERAFHKAKLRFVREMAASAPPELSSLLQTIPGVGPFVAASLIGEIQDIRRFKKAKHLVAYVGLDPRIKQSGHTLNKTGHLTKRGSPHLRHSMFIAANIAKRHDPYFKALYNKKRAEGKPYTVANCAVARKLLLVARAVWMSGEKYDPSFPNA
jgi:transposase